METVVSVERGVWKILRPTNTPQHDWFDNFIGKLCEVTFDIGVLLADACSMLRVLRLTNIAENQDLVAEPICWFSVKLRIWKFYPVFCKSSGHSSRAVYGLSCLRSLRRWIVGSNPTQVLEVCCVYVFILCCVVLCLRRGLATSWSLVQGVLPSVKMIMKLKEEARAHGGCRASEKKKSVSP
jgi:hypothetical protein